MCYLPESERQILAALVDQLEIIGSRGVGRLRGLRLRGREQRSKELGDRHTKLMVECRSTEGRLTMLENMVTKASAVLSLLHLIRVTGIDKNEIKRGMVLCHPGQIKPYKKFKAQIYVLKKEEGGRHTPFGNKYRPQFYLRTMDCTGEISLPEGVEMVMPGDNVTITVDLIYAVALNVGLRFAIREGGRTVGAGQITEIID